MEKAVSCNLEKMLSSQYVTSFFCSDLSSVLSPVCKESKLFESRPMCILFKKVNVPI